MATATPAPDATPRADASAGPSLALDVDALLATQPSLAFTAGIGKPHLDPASHKILLPYDAKTYALPACAQAAPPLTAATGLHPVIDGELGDWQDKGLVSIDRTGDGAGGLATHDVRALYLAESDTDYYAAVRVQEPWPKDDPAAILAVTFTPFHDDKFDSLPEAFRFHVNGDKLSLYDVATQTFSPVTAPEGEIAVKGNVIEMRLAKGARAAKLGPLYYVTAFAQVIGGKPEYDFGGAYVAGYQVDGACYVAMPNGRALRVQLERLAELTAEAAEPVYRAALAAIPTAEAVLDDTLRATDQITVNVGHQSMLGRILASSVILLNVASGMDAPNLLGLAAHEYAHGFNMSDFAMPAHWLSEGHSEWARLRAIESYFGAGPRLLFNKDHVDAIAAAEGGGTRRSVRDDPWPVGDGSWYYYSKSALLVDSLGAALGFDATRALFRKDEVSWDGDDGFLAASRDKLAAAGKQTSDAMWSGWIDSSAYGLEAFSPARLAADDDGDGLLNYEDPHPSAAINGDGIGEGLKRMYGLDLATPLPKDQRRLAADGFLDDWTEILPSELRTETSAVADANQAVCGASGKLVRYGAAADGEHILIAGEVESAPPVGAAIYGFGATLTTPAGKQESVTSWFNGGYMWHGDDATKLFSSHPGLKTMELWIDALPEGTTIQVGTFAGPDAQHLVPCNGSASFVPAVVP